MENDKQEKQDSTETKNNKEAEAKIAQQKNVLQEIREVLAEVKEQKKKDNLIALILPLVGVCVGGLLTFGTDYFFNKTKASNERIDKIESQYITLSNSIDSYCYAYFNYCSDLIRYNSFMKGKQPDSSSYSNPQFRYYYDVIDLHSKEMSESLSKVLTSYDILSGYNHYDTTSAKLYLDSLSTWRINEVYFTLDSNNYCPYNTDVLADTFSFHLKYYAEMVYYNIKKSTPELKHY